MNYRTVIIADNHPITRAGIKIAVEQTRKFKVIGQAVSGRQAVKLCNELQPDIILMDINMPNGNGLDATKTIHQKFPNILIIGISSFNHNEIQKEIIKAGAIGYISKDTDFDEIPIMIDKLIQDSMTNVVEIHNQFNLTTSEQIILTYLLEGKNRQQIADELSISLNTVKMHLRNLYQKLDVTNVNDAIKFAIHHYLVS